jgi:hypothetical protein
VNSFGLDFASNGFAWSMAMCLADSDNDGRSNGEELGDPECLWQKDSWEESGWSVTGRVTNPSIADKADGSLFPPQSSVAFDFLPGGKAALAVFVIGGVCSLWSVRRANATRLLNGARSR